MEFRVTGELLLKARRLESVDIWYMEKLLG